MTNDEYTFLMIPDLAEKPQSYLIYQGDDRSQPVAKVVFEDQDNYQVFNITDRALTNLEELNISLACEKFRYYKFFFKWD